MANMKAYKQSNVAGILRHVERLNPNPSNDCIDPERTKDDYNLAPDRGISSYDYYKNRLSQVYKQKRSDINTMFSWCIALPHDVPAEKSPLFFKLTYEFLGARYGAQNIVSACVHLDETTPHMHTEIMPIIANDKITANRPQSEKLDFGSVVNRNELRNFHKDYAKYMESHGMKCGVYTGITAAQGGNKTVRELKAETAREVEMQKQREVQVESRW